MRAPSQPRPLAARLAAWAHEFSPTSADAELAQRSLLDTLAVALAARQDPIAPLAAELPAAARWATLAHVLDYDDLHLPSTSHVSAVCVAATLACCGDARAYLAGAGVMARIGGALGWRHYTRGWHATCTAGAPGAAVAAAVAMGLTPEQTVSALALSIPAAGGTQRAFGSQAKSLQVGFAAQAGVRAARLAGLGATADPLCVEEWLGLVEGTPEAVVLDGAAVPGGLAIKLFPCCYALQRPISVAQRFRAAGIDARSVTAIEVETPSGTIQPLIHHRPATGLEAKFSLEYGIATALLDEHPGFASFGDDLVRREEARRLLLLVDIRLTGAGDGLLAGETAITVTTDDGRTWRERSDVAPGSPQRPPTAAQLAAKLADCGPDVPRLLEGCDWRHAAGMMADHCPATGGTKRGETKRADAQRRTGLQGSRLAGVEGGARPDTGPVR